MNTDHTVLLFYKFVDIADPKKLMEEQRTLCEELHLTGRILIGEEGINGTLEGHTENTNAYKMTMHADPRFSDMPIKESAGTGKAFPKLKVKVRNEIVTLGAGRFDVAKETAKEITADEFDKLYESDKDFVVLDLRNDYEVEAGYFDKTFDPKLKNFRDLPAKLKELEHLKDKKVVSVCTGGIRCEKATCLLRREGFTDLYQLKDGIHTYMAKYPGKHFKGTLFVFDDRLVTDVVPEVPNKVIVGKCAYCGAPSEQFYNDDRHLPSLKIIACTECFQQNAGNLRNPIEKVASS